MTDKTAVYPGTFDPLTLGHLDIVERALRTVPRLMLAVAATGKSTLFSQEQRIELALDALRAAGFDDRCEVRGFSGLLVDFMREAQVNLVIRGIRSIRDFEYEQDMESMNRHLYPEFEAIMYFARPELSMVSGTLVRDVARCGGPLTGLVTDNIGAALRERFRTSG